MEFLSVSATRLSSSIRDQSSRVTPHLAVLHFLVKPGFCHPQIAADGNRGNFQCLSDFLHGESAKIAKFDSFALSRDRKSTRLNSSHQIISYAVFCLNKKQAQVPRHCLSANRSGETLAPLA